MQGYSTVLNSRLLFQVGVGSLDGFQLIKYHIVKHLDVGSLHAGGPGLDDAGAFKLAQGIDNYRAGNAYPVRNLAGNQNSLIPVQLVKNMNDSLQFGEGKCADGRFHNLNLAGLLSILLINRAHHLQSHDSCSVLA